MKPIELLPGCRRVALLCALTAASGAAVAEEAQYEIDPEHAVVAFMVEHIGFARVLGSFTEVEGTFGFDEAAGSLGAIDVSVRTASASGAWGEARRSRRRGGGSDWGFHRLSSPGVSE